MAAHTAGAKPPFFSREEVFTVQGRNLTLTLTQQSYLILSVARPFDARVNGDRAVIDVAIAWRLCAAQPQAPRND